MDGNELYCVNKLIEKYLSSVGSISELDERLVVNLSDFSLFQAHLSLLRKGLTFCPTPGEADMGDLKRDLDR